MVLRLLVDGDQGDASTCNRSKPCVNCEARPVWITSSMSLYLTAVELVVSAIKILRQNRDAEKGC